MEQRNQATGTIEITKFEIPKYMLVFTNREIESKGMVVALVYFCGYKTRSASAKVLEIKNKGEAVVMTATKEVIEDTKNMIEEYCKLNNIFIEMIVRKEA